MFQDKIKNIFLAISCWRQEREIKDYFLRSSENNAITDAGVALPRFPLTIVMKFSNFKSLRISRNSKDFKKANIGSWRVRSRPSRLRRSGRY